jgi:penicillin-binding protein 1A
MVMRPRTLVRHNRLKIICVRLLALLLCVLLVALGYGGWFARSLESHLPAVASLADVRLNPATTIVSSDGVVLATLETRDRRPVALNAISPYVLKATIATEDARFYQHHGFDLRGVARALGADIFGGNFRGQGGSTITQQLARNLYLSNHKTLTRKIEEILLARKIERNYTKNEILEAYLNTIYYGNGCYGIEAAARTYFGKSAAQLTLGEAALLAGVPQRPTAYAPNLHPDAARRRRDLVLNRMIAAGDISTGTADLARSEPIRVLPPKAQNAARWRAPYFVNDVLSELQRRYGSEFITSGARIETTLNWRMQCAAENALKHGLRRQVANTGALIAIEPQTGYVRALVGGPDFRRNQFDAATRGLRQPGSAFKPFVYLAAFDTGICSLITQYNDEKSVYPNGGHDYVVHNYDQTYRGPMPVLDAIRRSVNTVAVRVGAATDLNRVIDYAQRLGISSHLEPGLPLALGDSGVHPIDLCSAYSAFANAGVRYDPTMIVRITDLRGQEVWSDDSGARRHTVCAKQRSLDQINVALREVVLHGTADAASAIPDAHGKTGTTSSHRDAWFVGYTGDLATAVWVAREQPVGEHDRPGVAHTSIRYQPMADATGGSLCAPIWRDFMLGALPIQRRINQQHGGGLHLVASPETGELMATLTAEAHALAAAERQAEGDGDGGSAAAVKVQPAGYVPAQDGSGPIVVTAPPDPPNNDQPAAGDSPEGQPASDSEVDIKADTPEDSDGAR